MHIYRYTNKIQYSISRVRVHSKLTSIINKLFCILHEHSNEVKHECELKNKDSRIDMQIHAGNGRR